MTSRNAGSNHPLYGKSGKFLITHIKTGKSFEVTGIYHWAKLKGLNATALLEIANNKPIIKPNGKITFRRQHKGYVCKRIIQEE